MAAKYRRKDWGFKVGGRYKKKETQEGEGDLTAANGERFLEQQERKTAAKEATKERGGKTERKSESYGISSKDWGAGKETAEGRKIEVDG
mgnify:CR=1 FL=1